MVIIKICKYWKVYSSNKLWYKWIERVPSSLKWICRTHIHWLRSSHKNYVEFQTNV